MRFQRALVAFTALVYLVGPASAETLVERGEYLVNGILTCGNCHTPRGPGGAFDDAKRLSGGPQVFDEPAFTVRGSNITPHKETGIGSWSAAELKRTLQDGVRPNGVPLAPIMPSAYYKVFTPRDIDAVVAYLRSVPPVANAVPAPVYKTAVTGAPPPGADKAMSEADLADPVKRGFYLVTIGHCMECHTPMSGSRHDFTRLGAGGQNFPGPWGSSTARNITSHPVKGLGAWSDEDIKKAITQGISRDGSRLKPPMAYGLYARLTSEDLSAILAYLRTIPARE